MPYTKDVRPLKRKASFFSSVYLLYIASFPKTLYWIVFHSSIHTYQWSVNLLQRISLHRKPPKNYIYSVSYCVLVDNIESMYWKNRMWRTEYCMSLGILDQKGTKVKKWKQTRIWRPQMSSTQYAKPMQLSFHPNNWLYELLIPV